MISVYLQHLKFKEQEQKENKMSTTITAIYDNYGSARHAISILRKNGIRDRELSILAADNAIDKNIELEENTKAPEGSATGATIGGALGATIAGLTAVGTVSLTGGVGILAAGPIVSAFAGAGAGAAAGGVIGGLIGLGIPETEAKIVDEKLGKGHILVGVSAESKEDKSKIKDLLENTNSQSITTH